MSRGSTRFDAGILRHLRASRKVGGHLLSAAELGRLVGTSKARILAYEAGTSVPESRRVLQLAQVFQVHPRELYQPARGRYDQIQDMRSYAGLTAAELAERLGVSRTTYRNIERKALLPVRDDGTLPLKLADALGIPLRMVHRALDMHPAAAARREAVTRHLRNIFERAHVRHEPAVVDQQEGPLQAVSELLCRPPSVVCRLVNYELGLYRGLLRKLEVNGLDAAYAQNEREKEEASSEATRLTELIVTSPRRVAAKFVRFFAEAMSAQQWRTVVSLLYDTQILVSEPSQLENEQVWDGLVARGYVIVERAPEGGRIFYLTQEGWHRGRSQALYYSCLYPRIPEPRFRFSPKRALPSASAPYGVGQPVGVPAGVPREEVFFQAYRQYTSQHACFPTAQQLAATLAESFGITDPRGFALSSDYLRRYLREFRERYNIELGLVP